jgi:hypothetical protein
MSGYDLKVRNIPGRGRGVIATRAFKKGEAVCVCPVIVLPNRDVGGLLDNYVFQWSDGYCAVALGLGSLINHSAFPNVIITTRIAKQEIVFWARKTILAATEIVHDYDYIPTGYDGG